MALVLTVTRYRDAPAGGDRKRFDEPAVSIGRAPGNDWMLPDPDQHLSKRHCLIRRVADAYTITDMSTNGVFINDAATPLGRGNTAPLRHGDRLALGAYELLVELEGAAPRDARDESAPFGLPVGSPDDPFGLGSIGAAAPSRNPARPRSDAALPPVPHEFDPFGGGGLPTADPGFAAAPGDYDAERPDWLRDPDERSGAFDLFGRAQSDHAEAQLGAFRVPEVAAPSVIPSDWQEPPPSVPSGRPAASPSVPSSAAPGAGAAGGGDAAQMLAAFCAGAGLDPRLLAREDPLDLMRSMGRLCREMTGGLRDVLGARASVKSEYRVEQTMIGSINNNPLKFSPDADQALTALLGRPRPGYVGGPDAVRDGFNDLKAHELALLSGMQTAVAALLREFDPARLTQRLERKSLLQNLVPGARRAKYWDAYEKHYKQIVAEVSDDVRGTFGRAFAKAYEAASKKM